MTPPSPTIGPPEPPRAKRQPLRLNLRRLVGGPLNGQVAESSGNRPVILLSAARPEGLLDEGAGVEDAHWNPEAKWYEVRP